METDRLEVLLEDAGYGPDEQAAAVRAHIRAVLDNELRNHRNTNGVYAVAAIETIERLRGQLLMGAD